MSEALPAPLPSSPVLRWLPAAFFALLVLPFDPFWVDFEQVRRGLLLVLAGLCLVALPRLPAVRGERFVRLLLYVLAGCTAVAWLGDVWFREPDAAASFQPFDALYRLAHWLGLLVVLRLGAATNATTTVPLAALLLVTSLFGLVQRLGLGEIAGYGVEREPVSVFGNLNVASEWTAIVAVALAALLPRVTGRARWLVLSALGLAGAYLVVNQSRSGLFALPIGLAVLAWLQRKARSWLGALAVATGAMLGVVVMLAVPRPEPVDSTAASAELRRSTSTLDVRLEIAKGATKLWAESPIFGRGPGQFAVVYPRVRSQHEIETSSHGRQFATEVRTAHDDWLELLVDGGVLALAAFALVLFALQRAQPDKALLLPVLVLLLLMLIRAPLWNAPAVAAALWFVGVPNGGAEVVPGEVPVSRWYLRWRRPLAIALGVLLVALGIPLLVGNHFGARYQAAVARGEQPDIGDAAAAAAWMPFEPRWFELLSREQLASRDLPAAARLAAKAITLRPHHPQLYLNLGEALAQSREYAAARSVAKEGLLRDPEHPELRVLLSSARAQLGDIDGAILAVVEHPHPLLRAQLGRHFAQLAQVAKQRGLTKDAARYLYEHHFLGALDTVGNPAPAALLATGEQVRLMTEQLTDAQRRDARVYALSALHFLDIDRRDAAVGLAEHVARLVPLTTWQRDLMAPHLDRLDTLPPWRAWLHKR